MYSLINYVYVKIVILGVNKDIVSRLKPFDFNYSSTNFNTLFISPPH